MKLGTKKKKYTSYSEEKKNDKAKQLIAVGLITTGLTVATYQFIVLDKYKSYIREATIKEMTSADSNYAQAYVINAPIEKGATIASENLVRINRTLDIVPEGYIQDISEIEGKVTRIALGPQTILTKEMIVSMEEEITDSVKNQDYSYIKVHTFLELGDYVDIHYKAVDGTDTIVSSKKNILDFSGTIFSINISEEERAYINNATVKAAISGGELYTTIYPDPENQNPAIVTYKLDSEIEELIKNDPNIINNSAEKLNDNANDVSNADSVDELYTYSEQTITLNKPEFIEGE